MKIAVCFNGVIRPSLDAFRNNREKLLNCLDGHEVDTYLFSWMYKDTIDASDLVGNIILMREPMNEHIRSYFNYNYLRCDRNSVERLPNHLKTFYRNKFAFDMICNGLIKYDRVIYTRPDLEIEINLEDGWLDKEFYNYPTEQNDQFGIATPEIMRAAWNFSNERHLGETMQRSINPEWTMDNIMMYNGVKTRVISKTGQGKLIRNWEMWNSHGK